jgi:hypothetical protein
MEYIINPDDIKCHHLIFKLPIKNQNSKYKYYYKLLYSNSDIHLKYILMKVTFHQSYVDTYDSFYKMKVSKKDPVFKKIQDLEIMILTCLNQHVHKKLSTSLYNELIMKDLMYVSPQTNHNQTLHLKISGIWEDEEHIGLVYKMYYAMSTEKLSNMICWIKMRMKFKNMRM